jgi:hypothetical protein
VTPEYVQLSVPPASSDNMSDVCTTALGGTFFGHYGEHCTVKGYTQLSSVIAGDPGVVETMMIAYQSLQGTLFGRNDGFCAVSSSYTQLSTNKLVDAGSSIIDMSAAYGSLGGASYGRFNQYWATDGCGSDSNHVSSGWRWLYLPVHRSRLRSVDWSLVWKIC